MRNNLTVMTNRIGAEAPECFRLREMIPALTSLDAQLDLLLERFRGLRSENIDLREKVADLEAAKRALQSKIELVAARLETLKSSLPIE